MGNTKYSFISKVTIGNKKDLNLPLGELEIIENRKNADNLENNVTLYENHGEIFYNDLTLPDIVKKQSDESGNLQTRMTYIPKSAFVPKFIISDRLKNFLLNNRFEKEYKDNICIVTFGKYVSDKVKLTSEEQEKLFTHDKREDRHRYKIPSEKGGSPYYSEIWDTYNIKGDIYARVWGERYNESHYRIDTIKWYLNKDTNELIMCKKLIFINYPIIELSNLNSNGIIKFEETSFYKDFLSNYFLNDILKDEIQLDLNCTSFIYLDESINQNKSYEGIEKVSISNQSEVSLCDNTAFYLIIDKRQLYGLVKENGELFRQQYKFPLNYESVNDIKTEWKNAGYPFDKGFGLRNTFIVPKITIDDNLKEYLLKNRVISKCNNGLYEVTFGEYIGKYANKSKREGNRIIRKGTKLEDTITIQNTSNYLPVTTEENELNVYNIYEYNNKKYVKINDDFYTIEPTKWFLNPEKNEMILAKKIYGNFVVDQIDNYISNVLLCDMLRNESYFRELEENKNPIERKIDEIIKLIPDDENKNIFIDRILKAAEEYNEKITLYKNNMHKKLIYDIEDEYTIKRNIMFELTNIENAIKNYSLNVYVFNDMYNYIESLNRIINKEEIDSPDEFQDLVKKLIDYSLNYLNNPDNIIELKNILVTNPSNLIDEYKKAILENKKSDQVFSDLNSFIYYLRVCLHPFLEKICDSVEKKSIVEEIYNDFDKMLKYNFQESSNSHINCLFSMINDIYIELNSVI